jgi:RNA ligase
MLDILERYYEDGLILKQVHPYLDLTIWNYSPKCQFDRAWDDITMQCRGLVTNSEGVVVARPFKKFKNYEEYLPEEIPNESFQIFEKMDGSLGILFYYKTEWVLATRGSFTSPQAIRGKEILEKYRMTLLCDKDIYESIEYNDITNYTILGEIIYKSNRIVVDYGDNEDFVLLGMINKNDGSELPYETLLKVGEILNMPVVKRYDGITDFNIIKETISNDDEGRVLLFENGFRIKIKGKHYLHLHSIITKVSSRDIWEHLKYEKSLDDILDKVPDEFYKWVKKTEKDLFEKFYLIKNEIENEFQLVINKKEFATKVRGKKYEHFLFKRLNSHSKEFNDMIWNKIYPDFSLPFKDKSLFD